MALKAYVRDYAWRGAEIVFANSIDEAVVRFIDLESAWCTEMIEKTSGPTKKKFEEHLAKVQSIDWMRSQIVEFRVAKDTLIKTKGGSSRG